VKKSPSPLTIYSKGVACIETSEFKDCAKPFNIVSAAGCHFHPEGDRTGPPAGV